MSTGKLQVGAAKVEITPSADELPSQYRGVHDPIYTRAIVLDNGFARAALVTLDAGSVSTGTWTSVSRSAEAQLAIPTDNLTLTATHTHSVPRSLEDTFAHHIVDAIRQASQATRPAQMAYGTGLCHINVNRNRFDSVNSRWWEGPNYDGVSDKTVAVLTFTADNDEPIAVLYNYGVHAVISGMLDQVSADIPGAASDYIEQSLGNSVVALWSEGTAGDQNPIYYQQTYDLRALRIAEYAERGVDISNSMPPGGEGLDRDDPRIAKLFSQQIRLMDSMGQMLGEEVLHTLRESMERPHTHIEIMGSHKVITCPGRTRTDTGRAGRPGTYDDGPDVPIRLSMLRLGDTIIGGVNGEVFTEIGLAFKRKSPYKHSIMATLTNGFGPSGYIASDAASGYSTFEVLSSKLVPGHAESAIVEGLLDLIEEVG
jgi:Neutral/alkaline non-lysosomal ceramidase, N-terminal